jgi:hypothetical protein
MLAGARRRGVAAVALAAAVAGRGCGGEDETPDGAVRAFASAARAGDRETMLELLGPATRDWLAAAAAHGSQMIGGPGATREIDLLGGRGPGPTRISLRSQDGKKALVDVVDERGVRSTVDVVEVDGRWRLELTGQLAGASE